MNDTERRHRETAERLNLEPCNVRREDWPYDCPAKDKRPADIVYACTTHGAWWTEGSGPAFVPARAPEATPQQCGAVSDRRDDWQWCGLPAEHATPHNYDRPWRSNRELRDRLTPPAVPLWDRIAGYVLVVIIVVSLVYFGAHAVAYMVG